ncbi:OsmC family protein [Franzmannia qiaohouensis]|uniref:OsmC family protein n=1 Tax=Franzmannia qiaohouensis TaxID=1329370 RepID=A0ABU1HDP5_9GAMM|nr:OsmC family protein [Halomonas qiaohouensis]MDR5905604.1 OsmC family protein [Halomonas qiaohouensis]
MPQHDYHVQVTWTGNLGSGTRDYRAYSRDHDIEIAGKATLQGSADPAFLGDAGRHNPEDMLVASLSACHMLWYLHLCAEARIVVEDYTDQAQGSMALTSSGGGHFTQVTLRPRVTVSGDSDARLAERLHERAHALCFIANSVNFPVTCEPSIVQS